MSFGDLERDVNDAEQGERPSVAPGLPETGPGLAKAFDRQTQERARSGDIDTSEDLPEPEPALPTQKASQSYVPIRSRGRTHYRRAAEGASGYTAITRRGRTHYLRRSGGGTQQAGSQQTMNVLGVQMPVPDATVPVPAEAKAGGFETAGGTKPATPPQAAPASPPVAPTPAPAASQPPPAPSPPANPPPPPPPAATVPRPQDAARSSATGAPAPSNAHADEWSNAGKSAATPPVFNGIGAGKAGGDGGMQQAVTILQQISVDTKTVITTLQQIAAKVGGTTAQ